MARANEAHYTHHGVRAFGCALFGCALFVSPISASSLHEGGRDSSD